MSESVMIAVADAVVDELRDTDFGQEIQPERSWADWEEILEVLEDKILVDVVPRSAEPELGARGEWIYAVKLSIGVRKRFGRNQQEENTGRVLLKEIDELALLTQRIAEKFLPIQGASAQTGRLATLEEAVWESEASGKESGTGIDVMWDKTKRLFLGVVRLTYRVPRNPGE